MSAKLGAWTISCPHIFTLRTSRHQSASRRKKQKLKWKNYFDSQESRQDRPQGLKQDNYWTFKNLGLTAVQCKGIAGCTYSLKSTLCRLQVTLQYFTWLKGKYVVLRLLFSLLEKLAWMTLFRGSRVNWSVRFSTPYGLHGVPYYSEGIGSFKVSLATTWGPSKSANKGIDASLHVGHHQDRDHGRRQECALLCHVRQYAHHLGHGIDTQQGMNS